MTPQRYDKEKKNLCISINKPNCKILWLDTGFIWNSDVKFWQKIACLVLKRKVLVIDTGQFAEMLERYTTSKFKPNDKSRQILNIYSLIVGTNFTLDHRTFHDGQIKTAMSSYVKNQSKITYSFYSLFDDLLRQLTPLFDMRNKLYGEKWGTARMFKSLSSDIVTDWKSIRKEARKKNQSLRERQRLELLGMHDAILKVSKSGNRRKKENLLNYHLKEWRKYVKSGNLDSMLCFFKSDYYKTIPYVHVRSWLISDLITGNEEPKSSDYFDVHMIAMILPFADYILVDKSMRNRIVNKLKLVAPKGRYKECKVIDKNEADWLLSKL